MRIEDLIEKEDVIITISHLGYIKGLPLQSTGNKGEVEEVQLEAKPERKIMWNIFL